jgi:hypothetical protein
VVQERYSVCRLDDPSRVVPAGWPYAFLLRVCDAEGNAVPDPHFRLTAVTIDGELPAGPNLLLYPSRSFLLVWPGKYAYKLDTRGIPAVAGGNHTLELTIEDADGNVTTVSTPFRLRH